MLAAPLVLLAGGWAIFYVLKQPPPAAECMTRRAPGVEQYRGGLGAYATFSAAVLGALIASVSRGPRTMYALAVCAWLATLYNADDDAFWPHALVATILGALGALLLACGAAGTLAMRRPRTAELAYLWTALLVFVPATAGIVASEGTPGLCLG